jgi:type VI protein secretion system component Hcp
MKKSSWRKAIMIGLLGLGLETGTAAQQVLQQATIAPAGALWEGFERQPLSDWELIAGARVQPVDGNPALVCGGGGLGFWGAAQARDFDLKFRYRHSQGVGRVVLNASGEPPNHSEYALMLAPAEVILERVGNGQSQGLNGAAARLQPNAWYDVQVQVQNGRISVAVGSQSVLTATDPQPLPAGGIAFGALEGSGFAFDDVSLTPLPGGGQPPVQAGAPAGSGDATPITLPSMPSPQPPATVHHATQTAPGHTAPPASVQSAMPTPAPSGEETLISAQTAAGTWPMVKSNSGMSLHLLGITQSSGTFFDGITKTDWGMPIEAFEFAFGTSTSVTSWTHQPSGAGAAKFSPLTITRHLDGYSPAIYLACAKGTLIKEAMLSLQLPGMAGNRLLMRMKDVRVTAVEAQSDDGPAVTEAIVLSFGKVLWWAPDSSVPEAGWDLEKNTQFTW